MRSLAKLFVLGALGLSACAGSDSPDGQGNADAGGDSGPACGTIISFDPQDAFADPVAQIQASVNVVSTPGVFDYSWEVTRSGSPVATNPAASDGSRISFVANIAGPYHVTVQISGAPVPNGCSYAETTLNVGDPNANTSVFRFRTVPAGSTPPQESVIQVAGGADYVRDILLDPGLAVSLTIQKTGTTTGVPSYVKLMPVGAPNAFVEAFTDGAGAFSTRLLGQNHTALVIPQSTAYAPALVTWTPTSTVLAIGTGTVVTGVVKGPSGSGLSGAKVQLESGILPSTTATTAVDGSFSLRESFTSGSTVTVRVTPPAASGLPKLEATGTFDLGTSVQVTYAASLATCDLSNTPVKRSGNAQAGAQVTVVGSLPSSGSVAAGITLAAAGTVRIAATADGAGKLPSTLVPRGALTAVVKLAPTDFAVSALDTSTCAATTIDAPPAIVRTGTAKNVANAVLSAVRVEATPIGALAAADAQTVSATTDAGGGFSIALASGGFYDVRFVDPYARAARLQLPGIAPAGVPTSATLPKALVISGKVSISGNGQPVAGASIQLLCATCTGIDAARPIAQTASDGLSTYRLAVPDPGTM